MADASSANNKRVRKCSHCREPGHTKRTCRFTKAGITLPSSSAMQRKKQSPKPHIHVSTVIHQDTPAPASPHVVDLKDRQREDIWKQVSAYKPTPAPQKIRMTVNFADMVQQANRRAPKRAPMKETARAVKRWKVNRFGIERFTAAFGRMRTRASAFADDARGLGDDVRAFAADGAEAFSTLFHFRKFAYSAAILFLMIGLPFPALSYYQNLKQDGSLVIAESTNAFLSLRSSIGSAFSSDFDGAQAQLAYALQSFSNAESIIEEEHQIVKYIAGLVPQVDSGQHLLSAGHHMALANTYVIKGIRNAQDPANGVLTDRMLIFRNHLSRALPQYRSAYEELSRVSGSIVPAEHRESFDEFKYLFAIFLDDVQDIISLIDTFEAVFGESGLRRYLIMNQNVFESRPTGGFMGSYLRVDVQQGKLLAIDTPADGIYGVSGQSNLHFIPPGPMQLISDRAAIQDANWYPDASASARNIERFYEDAYGITVDGTIFVNSTLLEDVLRFTGPVTVGDETFSADDVLEKVQLRVEETYEEEGKPKQIIGQLLDQVLKKLNTVETIDIVRFLSRMQVAARQKEFMGSFHDQRVQVAARAHGVTGEVALGEPNQDYLFVVGTNIGGGKSDARIQQTIEHQAEIQPNGQVVNTVIVRRAHTGDPSEQFFGDYNINYLRLYVPEGATLVEAGGFTHPDENNFQELPKHLVQDPLLAEYEQEEQFDADSGTRVTTEFGKTVFGNWVTTAPGETSEVFFQYVLPFSVTDTALSDDDSNASLWKKVFVPGRDVISSYQLFVQKQSGVMSDFSSRIIYPSGWAPAWRSDETIRLARNGGEYARMLDEDFLLGLIMRKQ